MAYLATGKAEGTEMAWRIRKHQESRPDTWLTVEAPRSLAAALEKEAGSVPTILLEDVGSLTANCLPWVEEREGELSVPSAAYETAQRNIEEEIEALFEWCTRQGKHLVVVSSEVGLGFLPPSPVGRLYKDVIGDANEAIARRADRVYLVVAGLPQDITAGAERALAELGLASQSRD